MELTVLLRLLLKFLSKFAQAHRALTGFVTYKNGVDVTSARDNSQLTGKEVTPDRDNSQLSGKDVTPARDNS